MHLYWVEVWAGLLCLWTSSGVLGTGQALMQQYPNHFLHHLMFPWQAVSDLMVHPLSKELKGKYKKLTFSMIRSIYLYIGIPLHPINVGFTCYSMLIKLSWHLNVSQNDPFWTCDILSHNRGGDLNNSTHALGMSSNTTTATCTRICFFPTTSPSRSDGYGKDHLWVEPELAH